MDDPILLSVTAFTLIFTPLLSVQISRKRLKNVFILPALAMAISFPMFLLVVIMQGGSNWSMTVFIISMSLWTGGFFGLFFSIIYYNMNKKKRS